MAKKIMILGTGGTIAGQGHSGGGSVGYQAGQIGIATLLEEVAHGCVAEDILLQPQQVTQIDSKDVDVTTWQKLAQLCQTYLKDEDVVGLVVTHGTDTLEETAWFLQSVLQPCKPLVLTSAMRPATALSADGPANLRDAVVCAASGVAGVWVVSLGEVHSAQWVRKVHPYRINAFASGAYGPAGWVEESRIRWVVGAVIGASSGQSVAADLWCKDAAEWPWVEIVTSVAAARSSVVDALVAAGVKGLVIAGTGNGSIHQALLPALASAAQQGVEVWRTTRCEQGQIVQADGAHDPAVSYLTPVKARISLMLQLLVAAPQ